jgi:hypothetical protein
MISIMKITTAPMTIGVAVTKYLWLLMDNKLLFVNSQIFFIEYKLYIKVYMHNRLFLSN